MKSTDANSLKDTGQSVQRMFL